MLPQIGLDEKLIVVMVGLPARGKSYITKKISNYLKWLNINSQIFNVGNKRRLNFNTSANQADFFNPNDEENVNIRDQLALATLNELLDYLTCDNGQVGIFDATNSTYKRRECIINHIKNYMKDQTDCHYNILFLESICNDEKIIERNIMLKLNGPDYNNVEDKQVALNDFKQRVSNYEAVYQSVTSTEFANFEMNNLQYLKIINIINLQTFNIDGFLPIILNSFLKTFHISKKNIYLISNHIDYENLFQNTDLSILSSKPLPSASRPSSRHNVIKIPTSFSLDQAHDLILLIESITNDTIIQTKDEFLLNGILKYYNLFNYSKLTLLDIIRNNVIRINPDLYTVQYSRIRLQKEINNATKTKLNSNTNTTITTTTDTTDRKISSSFINNKPYDSVHTTTTTLIDSPPIMTRSNSVLSTYDDILTPIDSIWDSKFNYKDLNLSELTSKLELLKK